MNPHVFGGAPFPGGARSYTPRAACALLSLALGCGSSHAAPGDPATDAAADPAVTGTDGPPSTAPRADGGQPASVDGGAEDAGEASDGEAADAGPLDAGIDAAEPPPPDWDASVPSGLIGNTYAETNYRVLAPMSLANAFNVLASDPGSTRIFVNDVRADDAGVVSVRYGAASPDADGGLVWQEATPVRQFHIAPSSTDPSRFVSERFTYMLHALVPNPTSASSRFLLNLEAVDAIWSAAPSASFDALNDGTLFGTVMRHEAESRKLSVGTGIGCVALCGFAPICTSPGVSTLANLLDCTNTPMDADVDGDGTLDGYRLSVAFASQRVPFAASGQ